MTVRIRSYARVASIAALAAISTIISAPARAEAPPVPPAGSLRVRVNCGAGQRVGPALALSALLPTPIVVTIVGVCPERILIKRDDVILQGAAPGAGFASPATGNGTLITLDGARRITLYQLGLTPAAGSHDDALEVLHGAQVHVGNAVVQGAVGPTIAVFDGGLAEVFDSEIRDTTGPVSQVQVTGAHLQLTGCTIENGQGTGVSVNRGGSLLVDTSTIRGHNSVGVSVAENASATLIETEVISNRRGLSVFGNATVQLAGANRVADSELDGIILASGASLSMGGGTIVENNLDGVRAAGGSKIQLASVAIRNNRESGIALGDTSYLQTVGGSSITDNAQWGIFCAAPPAAPQVPVGFPAASITGNGAGATNCPPLGIVGSVP
jgi:hypothetical protein